MHHTLRLTKLVVVPLLITVSVCIAEAGSRRARREARRNWQNCYPAWERIPQDCPSSPSRPPVPDPNAIHSTALATDRAAKELPVSAEARAVAAANNAFAFDLYRQLSAGQGDRFFSPIGISMGLALLSRGATGETQRQILDVAHLDPAQPEILQGYAELRHRLASGGKGYQLRMANRLWLERGFPLDPAFRKVATDHFGAEPGEVDFKNLPAARETINRWGAESTEGRISELLSPQTLTDATRFVLTSGIYFKGTWKYQFVPAATTEAPFHVTPERDVKARMMQQTGALRYAETADVQILELPYAGEQLAMVVLLPKKIDGLAGLEVNLTADAVARWLIGLHEEGEVEVHLPKLKFTTEVPLKDELASLGMVRAFSDEAEFPAIATDRGQKLNDAVQRAFVDVNEEGTEAAAVTGFIGGNAPGPVPQHILFKADHPFVFLIHDARSSAILFLGRVMEPAGE